MTLPQVTGFIKEALLDSKKCDIADNLLCTKPTFSNNISFQLLSPNCDALA